MITFHALGHMRRLAQGTADAFPAARTMGEAGLRRAYHHYTWRTVARQVAVIYAAVLADARAPIALPQE